MFRQDDEEFSREEREEIFSVLFLDLPWNELARAAVGIDIGCGSGRWSATADRSYREQIKRLKSLYLLIGLRSSSLDWCCPLKPPNWKLKVPFCWHSFEPL